MKLQDTVIVLVVVALVIVFGGVGLLFYFNLRELLAMTDGVTLTGAPAAPSKAVVPPPSAPPAAQVAVRSVPAPPLDAGVSLDGLTYDDDPTLEAPLKAVRRELARCFSDQADHHPQAGSVRLHFRPLPDGGFAEVEVQSDSWQDPYLDACLADVFAELPYAPTGREDFAAVVRTFRYARGR